MFLLKLTTKRFLEAKRLSKFKFSDYFSEAETKYCYQKNGIFSNKFEMLMPGSNAHFVEVSAHVLLKVATKGSFRGKSLKH